MNLDESKEKLKTNKEYFTYENQIYNVCIVPSIYEEMITYLSYKKNDKNISPIEFSSNKDYRLIGWWTDGIAVITKSIEGQRQ